MKETDHGVHVLKETQSVLSSMNNFDSFFFPRCWPLRRIFTPVQSVMQMARHTNANEDTEARGTALTFNPPWTMSWRTWKITNYRISPKLRMENRRCIIYEFVALLCFCCLSFIWFVITNFRIELENSFFDGIDQLQHACAHLKAICTLCCCCIVPFMLCA